LYKFLQNNKYDYIVSVHVFASLALDDVIKNFDDSIRAYNVSTDYTCYPEISNTNLEKYFIAHKNLIQDHVDNGIDPSSIIPTGIPVRDAFYTNRMSKEQARAKLGIDNNKKLVIIAGGSMGAGPIEDIAVSLISNYENECNIAVICGSNEKLFESLKRFPELILYEFVSDIEVQMQAADILITKAGGLTITEAAAVHLPIVFINAVSGCETYNREFFAQNGYALSSTDVDDVVENVGRLLNDEKLYNDIKNNLARDFSVSAQQVILNNLIEGNM
ncbi:MAG: glycosyltransferase, partial [Clostridia bacterium]|nr:glycosyltransferase [Clostridia bacterium]